MPLSCFSNITDAVVEWSIDGETVSSRISDVIMELNHDSNIDVVSYACRSHDSWLTAYGNIDNNKVKYFKPIPKDEAILIVDHQDSWRKFFPDGSSVSGSGGYSQFKLEELTRSQAKSILDSLDMEVEL